MIRKKPIFDQAAEADSLRQSLLDAYATLQLAQLRHEHAMEVAADAGPLTENGITSVRRAGFEYAEAVSKYSNAAMAWLSFADRHLEEAKEFARKRVVGLGDA